MKRLPSIVSHLAAVAIGIAIAASSAGVFSQGPVVEAPEKSAAASSPAVANGGAGTAAVKQRGPTRMSLKTGDFKMAWDAIPGRHLRMEERWRLQQELLEKWAEVDLQGALDAAAPHAWDGTGNKDPFSQETFFSAFDHAFSERPLEAWTLIRSGRYGMAAPLLREKWLECAAPDNGDLVISLLPEMSADFQNWSIVNCIGRLQGPERDALMAKIIAQAGDGHKDWLKAAVSAMHTDASAPPMNWKTLPVAAERDFTVFKWGAALGNMDADQISAELAAVPPDEKAAAADAAVCYLNGNSPDMLAVLDFAMTADSWESLAKSNRDRIVTAFADAEPGNGGKIAEWAMRLPQRADSAEIYQAAVGRYIGENLQRAKEWVEAMPEGSWHRDNALATYSREVQGSTDDAGASQWALDSIRDPKIKAQATRRRDDLEQRRKDRLGKSGGR